MSATQPVADSIKHSIQKNGFPDKVVRLPFKPVYDSCKKNGTALADVLEQLKEEGILGALEGDYIVFRSPEKAAENVSAKNQEEKAGSKEDPWWSKLSGLGDMSSMAKEAMANLTPEQMAEIRDRVANMSEDEKKNMLKTMSEMMKPKGKS